MTGLRGAVVARVAEAVAAEAKVEAATVALGASLGSPAVCVK